ncbi:MAG TPA: hypothetical protein VN673_14205 [Clostridia bacterium]|nr:hypothetical protein [Clostridia bacterium]
MKKFLPVSYANALTILALSTVLTACSKSEPAAGDPTAPAKETTSAGMASQLSDAAEGAVAEGKKVVAEQKAVVQKTVQEGTAQVQAAAATATTQIQNTTATVKTQLQSVATSANAQLQNATASADSQVQALIEKAKGLVTNKQYQDALTTLQQLGNLKLTPAQEKVVTDLKTQIQSALASSGLNNLLNRK